MAKLLFQIPNGKIEAVEGMHANAAFAMLGVVAIIGIISLVFLFQHALSIPDTANVQAYVIQNADALCEQNGILAESAYVDVLRADGFKCWRTKEDASLSCCYK